MQRSTGFTRNPFFDSLKMGSVNKAANYTAQPTDFTIRFDATTAPVTLSLPAAATLRGQVYAVMKIDASANTVTIDPNGAELISGDASIMLASRWQSVLIQSNGASWDVLAAAE